jgi:hypothetical protein
VTWCGDGAGDHTSKVPFLEQPPLLVCCVFHSLSLFRDSVFFFNFRSRKAKEDLTTEDIYMHFYLFYRPLRFPLDLSFPTSPSLCPSLTPPRRIQGRRQ